ncbi:MAG: metal ABC transporter ATP-binding protein [Candidatus Tokpelaia sp.]|uniref:ATP-binding cassette domain-containing protein n=1 Tax=Candidatus Tokpelaia sp. TaxID=2233777 RepID=UPI00123848E6|nr:MAG: metal ABC transporter ATP-binding protein [Candidatus Tokpelaia sp.]KAA6207232.1 MAG: metal ABC transporter ATP-binding protein [Candidatus Tokpelaia sp.]KAA6406002.1 zinc ABC transporter ATP-binding protein [Candidatus Tokpelaia sp.]
MAQFHTLFNPEKRHKAAKNKPAAGKQKLVSLYQAGIADGAHWRVRHITFSVARGEIITLIGPNGSGKSTVAKLAAGILAPTEGRIERWPKLKIGYVPQKLHFDKSLPLNVRRLMCLTAKLPQADIDQALAEVGMAHKQQEEVATLSGGELQRVLLARAVARRPDLLILDEPLQGVDFSWEATLYQKISEYCQKLQCGIMLISHDLHIVMAASDRVLCLNGHICCSGKPQEVAKSAEYLSLFGHRAGAGPKPPLLALYEHRHDHRHD